MPGAFLSPQPNMSLVIRLSILEGDSWKHRTANSRRSRVHTSASPQHRLPLAEEMGRRVTLGKRDHRPWTMDEKMLLVFLDVRFIMNSEIHVNYQILISSSYFTAGRNGKTRQTDESWCSRRFCKHSVKLILTSWLTVTCMRLISIQFSKW